VVKTDLTTAPGGDNGFELDGDDGLTCTYQSSPKIYNATFVGAAGINGGPAVDNNLGIEWKEASRGEIRNCVFSNYNRGVQFATTTTHTVNGTPTDDTYAAWNAGTLKLINNTFIGATSPVRVNNADGSSADLTKFAADGNTSVPSVAGFLGHHSMNVSNNTVTTKHDLIPGADIATSTLPAVDGFFTPANYRGAFKSGEKSWLSDYSVRALIGLEGNLGACITDINTDGTTNTSDFLLLLGAFGTACQ
jgi:hypothetical protein